MSFAEWNLGSVVAVLLGLAFLRVFYRVVEVKWPESYFGSTDLTARAVSASPVRYVMFRFGPLIVSSAAVAVAVARLMGPPVQAATALGALHVLLTTGVALVAWARLPRNIRRHRVPVAILRAVVGVGAVIVAYSVGRAHRVLTPMVPEPSELLSALWTALAAGITGAYITMRARGGAGDVYSLIEKARDALPHAYWHAAAASAMRHNADVNLVRAVMIVESLERPKWFRRLERLKGRFWSQGTYGVMQVASDRPLGDLESIDIAVASRMKDVRVTTEDGHLDGVVLERFAKSYNPECVTNAEGSEM